MLIEPFYDPRTSTLTYVVSDPTTHDCVVIDPVLDFDPASGRIWTESVDRVSDYLRREELRAWRRTVGAKGHLFPGATGQKFLSRESLEKAYRVTLALADKHSPHGWRAAFSTLAREGGFDRDVVELALDHVHDNEVARAYDRGGRLEQRVKLAGWWSDQLSQAQRGADVVR